MRLPVFEHICDGRNEHCEGIIKLEDTNWFTSSLGFCNCCFSKIYENLSESERSLLYDECEADNEAAIEILLSATK